jgi:hypothetical protein
VPAGSGVPSSSSSAVSLRFPAMIAGGDNLRVSRTTACSSGTFAGSDPSWEVAASSAIASQRTWSSHASQKSVQAVAEAVVSYPLPIPGSPAAYR